MEVDKSSTASGEASVSSGNLTRPPQKQKKKRNLPGMPDPNADVISLSPKTLMETNRFVCEICNKGFQRDQNLQLHRRGHNLPWKLRQRTTNEIRKRVYVCPEPTCIHHNPSRALGDLTGIKKHFFRKHGEKSWKCERCSKKYAVQSDWKAHSKTCGTREYKCECGTLFSRRDSFVTHRAFCDTLTEENSKAKAVVCNENMKRVYVGASSSPPISPGVVEIASALSNQSPELPENPLRVLPQTSISSHSSTSSSHVLVTESVSHQTSLYNPSSFSNVISILQPGPLCLNSSPPYFPSSTNMQDVNDVSEGLNSSSLFPFDHYRQYATPQQPAMSATALLQKAAEIGSSASKGSLLRGLGLALPSSSAHHDLGLGLMMGPSSSSLSVFGTKPTTLDLLGLGLGVASPALFGTPSYRENWNGQPEREPNGLGPPCLEKG